MQAKWPELDFLFSLTYNGSADWRVMAPAPVAALDVHYWFVMSSLLPDQTGYWEDIHGPAENDLQFRLWNGIVRHKRVTAKIRGARPQG
jgi:hypothetical protein